MFVFRLLLTLLAVAFVVALQVAYVHLVRLPEELWVAAVVSFVLQAALGMFFGLLAKGSQ